MYGTQAQIECGEHTCSCSCRDAFAAAWRHHKTCPCADSPEAHDEQVCPGPCNLDAMREDGWKRCTHSIPIPPLVTQEHKHVRPAGGRVVGSAEGSFGQTLTPEQQTEIHDMAKAARMKDDLPSCAHIQPDADGFLEHDLCCAACIREAERDRIMGDITSLVGRALGDAQLADWFWDELETVLRSYREEHP